MMNGYRRPAPPQQMPDPRFQGPRNLGNAPVQQQSPIRGDMVVQNPQSFGGGGLGGSIYPARASSAVASRPVATTSLSPRSRYAGGMMNQTVERNNGYDRMTGVATRQFANQPNAVEAARMQQGSGLGGSLPQPKQYSNAPNIVNYTNRTYAQPAPTTGTGTIQTQPASAVTGTAPIPTQTQQPAQQPALMSGNERDIREKEAMQ